MKTRVSLLLVLIALGVIAGCLGWARTREYVPVQGKSIPLVDGWAVKPWIYAYKDVVIAKNDLWEFSHMFWFARTFARGNAYVDTCSVAEIDTIDVVFVDLDTSLILPFHDGRTYVSGESEKELVYATQYYANSQHRPPWYPKGQHEVVLRMRVRVYPGVHHYVRNGHDSVAVDRTRVLRDTIIEAPLRFHESKSPAVNYGD
jgi:hypothetical protein